MAAVCRPGAIWRVVLGLLCLALASCASIPLGTLWQLRGFDGQALAALAPEQVRVAARVEAPPVRIRDDSMRLTLTLTPRDGSPADRHVFALRPSATSDIQLAPTGGRPWQVFELDDAGLRAMRALQPKLADAKRDYSSFAFSVASNFDGTVPPGTREVVFSVRLRLSDAQAPFTLFERAKVAMSGD